MKTSKFAVNNDGVLLHLSAPNLRDVWEFLTESSLDESKTESITLPDGRSISYNDYLFHNCFAKGRITEDELINESLMQEEGGAE